MLVFYVVLGLVIMAGCVFLAKSNFAPHITTLAATIIFALLAPWGVYSITEAVAKDNDQTFYEFWNGSESAVSTNVIPCER